MMNKSASERICANWQLLQSLIKKGQTYQLRSSLFSQWSHKNRVPIVENHVLAKRNSSPRQPLYLATVCKTCRLFEFAVCEVIYNNPLITYSFRFLVHLKSKLSILPSVLIMTSHVLLLDLSWCIINQLNWQGLFCLLARRLCILLLFHFTYLSKGLAFAAAVVHFLSISFLPPPPSLSLPGLSPCLSFFKLRPCSELASLVHVHWKKPSYQLSIYVWSLIICWR